MHLPLPRALVVFTSLIVLCAGVSTSCTPSGGSAGPPPMPEAKSGAGMSEKELAEVGAVLYGRFVHVGGQNDLDARNAAIEAVIEEIPSLVRGRVRSSLQERAVVVDRLTIKKEGEDLSIDFADKITLTAPLGGDPVEFTPPNGDQGVKLSFAMTGHRLVQTMQGPNGGIRRIYTPQADGKLEIDVAIFAERLPKTLTYTLHYALDKAP